MGKASKVPTLALCATKEATEIYRGLIPAEIQIESFTSVSEIIKLCVANPPDAILVDMASTLHVGTSDTAPLYELGIDLPVLRCTQSPNGQWIAMCQAPFKRLELVQAVQEILSGDPSWRHPKYVRRFVRVDFMGRARFRPAGGEWVRGNFTSASISGLFLLSLEGMDVGAELEIEALDTTDPPPVIRGNVTWVHRWEDGPHLPGMGIDFERASVPPEFRMFLANEHVRRGTRR
jgi:hypothetical protein